MYIDFSIENQTLRRSDKNILAANSQNLVWARFDFDEEWELLNKKAVFEYNNTAYSIGLENNECKIPYEVLQEGFFTVGVIAVNTDEAALIRATSNTVEVEVKQGPKLDSENAKEPAPLEIERIEAIAQSVRNDADNGKFDPQISIGTTYSIVSTESAKVTNTGTPSKPVLEFYIPRGRNGISLLSPKSKAELETALRSLITVGDTEKVHILWRGNETDFSYPSGSITLLNGCFYTVSCTRSTPVAITYNSIEKALSQGKENWCLLYSSTLAEELSSITCDISAANNEFSELSVLLYIPKLTSDSDISLFVDSKEIGRMAGALSSEKNTVMLIDARKKYMWNTEFTACHTDNAYNADDLGTVRPADAGNISIARSFYRGESDEYLKSLITLESSAPIPAGAVIRIMAKSV